MVRENPRICLIIFVKNTDLFIKFIEFIIMHKQFLYNNCLCI